MGGRVLFAAVKYICALDGVWGRVCVGEEGSVWVVQS